MCFADIFVVNCKSSKKNSEIFAYLLCMILLLLSLWTNYTKWIFQILLSLCGYRAVVGAWVTHIFLCLFLFVYCFYFFFFIHMNQFNFWLYLECYKIMKKTRFISLTEFLDTCSVIESSSHSKDCKSSSQNIFSSQDSCKWILLNYSK